MVSADHSAAEDVDCHSAASFGCAEGTDHDSTDWMVLGTSVKTLLRVGAWMSIASKGLSLKPPLLGLHLLALVVDNNSVIHQCLKIGVCIGYKLELQTIIQTLEKAALLISIISHLIWSVT